MEGKSLTKGTPWINILFFALPVLLGILLQQLYNTVDTIIVGNCAGEADLSAVGTTSCLTLLFLALANGFSAGAGVIIAQLYGAGKEKEVRANASSGILLLLGIGGLSTIAGIAFCYPVLKYLLNVHPDLLSMATTYFMWYSVGLLFQFGYNIVAAILRAVGDSKASTYFLAISSVVNVGLDLLFIAVFHWGVAGAAIATDIAQIACCAASFFYMNRKYQIFRFRIKEYTWDKELAGTILRVGAPMAMQQLIVSFGFFFIQYAVNGYGKDMTASFTVGQRLEVYLTMPMNALQITLATYTGQNIGAGKLKRVTSGAMQAIILSIAITAVISTLFYFLAGPIIGLFGIGEGATVLCIQHIQATAICMLLFALYFPLLGVFQGEKHGIMATAVAGCALLVRVIAVYTLCYIPFMDYRIIWWNMIFGFAAGCIVTWILFLRGNRRRKLSGRINESAV